VSIIRPLYTPQLLLKIGWRRKWQIVLPAIAVAAAASSWVYRLPDRYRSDTLLLVLPQRVPETFVRSAVATRGDDRLQSITHQILSRTQLEQIIRDFNLYAERRDTVPMQDVVDAMRAHDIEILSVKGDAFRLSFIANRPDVAMQVASRLASLFIGQTSRDRASIADGTDRFLEVQLEDARRKLVDNESRLEDYRRRHNGELPKQLDANVQGLHSTEMQLQAMADSLNRDRDRQLTIERALKEGRLSELLEAGPRSAAAPAAATSPPSAAEQLARAEASLKDMQQSLTAQHPDVVALQQTIADLQRRVQADGRREPSDSNKAEALRRNRQEELQGELTAVEAQIGQKVAEEERLRGMLAGYQKRIEIEPAREAELSALTRDYDTLQDSYRSLLTRKQESEIAANLERQQIGGQFRVLDPARLPERPFAPNRSLLYACAAVGGFGLGLLFAGVLEWLDRGLRTEEDVYAALSLPVLAMIPYAAGRQRRTLRRGLVS
jgi:polysaccharide chain length determinant protein (PEP-CTERM system associated)